MKKEDKITVLCQIVNQIIDENQLPDEDKIRKILEEKGKKEEDILKFLVPDRHIYKNYLLCSDRGIRHIDNPYTDDETEEIKEWIELHPNDIRGLALGLWFTGDISLVEIANMKPDDNYNYVHRKWERARFTTRALELHLENKDYVFMAIKEGRWEKLTPQSFQMKLYHICNRLGIGYKKLNRNEAMVCKE